jgi:hypothetical protein
MIGRPATLVRAFGKSKTLAAWSVDVDIPVRILRVRIAKGWDPERALSSRPKLKTDHGPQVDGTCPQCGGPKHRRHTNATKFCSSECWLRAARAGRAVYRRRCSSCREPFETATRNVRRCPTCVTARPGAARAR